MRSTTFIVGIGKFKIIGMFKLEEGMGATATHLSRNLSFRPSL